MCLCACVRMYVLTDGTVAAMGIISTEIPLMKLVAYFWTFEASSLLRAKICGEQERDREKQGERESECTYVYIQVGLYRHTVYIYLFIIFIMLYCLSIYVYFLYV